VAAAMAYRQIRRIVVVVVVIQVVNDRSIG
jgi:hypothetical protein